MFLMRTT